MFAYYGRGQSNPTIHYYHQTRQTCGKLNPFAEEKLKLFGKLKGSMTLLTDITQPIDAVWNADE